MKIIHSVVGCVTALIWSVVVKTFFARFETEEGENALEEGIGWLTGKLLSSRRQGLFRVISHQF